MIEKDWLESIPIIGLAVQNARENASIFKAILPVVIGPILTISGAGIGAGVSVYFQVQALERKIEDQAKEHRITHREFRLELQRLDEKTEQNYRDLIIMIMRNDNKLNGYSK